MSEGNGELKFLMFFAGQDRDSEWELSRSITRLALKEEGRSGQILIIKGEKNVSGVSVTK